MATQVCPNCKEDSFTWFVDEEVSSLTIWGCSTCGYRAYENESLEKVCANCNQKTECRLEDKEKKY